jgi:hypothetical protein
MKYIILAGGFALAMSSFQIIEPVYAQGDVRQLCTNKHGLGKRWPTASESERQAAAARIQACIRSGGKS